MSKDRAWARAFGALGIALAVAGCGDDRTLPDPTGTAGSGGDGMGVGGTGGGGGEPGIPWTSGTAHFTPVWESSIRCFGTTWTRLGPLFLDEEDDVWVGGSLGGDCTLFEGDAITTVGDDVIAAELAGDSGAARWTRHFPRDADETGVDAVGWSGGLILEGGFAKPIAFDDGETLEPAEFSHSPSFTTFVVAVGEGGEPLWSRALAVEAVGLNMATNGSGATGAVASGFYESDFGGGPLGSAIGTSTIAGLSGTAEHVWSRSIGSDLLGSFDAQAVAVGNGGNVVVTGTLLGTASFGDIVVASISVSSPIVALFDATGDPRWAIAIPASQEACRLVPTTLSDGAVVVSGVCAGSLDFIGDVLGEASGSSGFLARIEADGAVTWARTFGGAGMGTMVVAEGADGGVVVGGGFDGEVDLGDGTLVSAGTTDAFLAAVDASGATEWSQRMGDEWDQAIDAIARASNGDLVMSSFGRLSEGGDDGDGFAAMTWARLAE